MIQLQFLNALLNSGDSSLLLINNLSEDFFSDYVDEYKFIVNHLRQYGQIPDKITFLDKFPNFDIVEVNESRDYLIDALFEDRDKRFLAKTFNDIRKLLIEDKTEEAMNLYSTQ
jgi:replicative DNA helicase